LLYGSNANWKAGVIIVSQNRWYFREIMILYHGAKFVDEYGPTYHSVLLVDDEIYLGTVGAAFNLEIGGLGLQFWDYATLLPDTIHDTHEYRYSIERSGWQHLNARHEWSEFD
jgi:hypothetical protein